MSEFKNTVYKKLVYPGEDSTNDIIKQAIKIQKFYMYKKPEYPYAAHCIIFITMENTRQEIMDKIETILSNDKLKEEMSIGNNYNYIYPCDIAIVPINLNELDIDYVIQAVYETIPDVKVVAIMIDNLKKLKDVPSVDMMFSASIKLIDAKLKEIAIDNNIAVIYNKQIPRESMMFV